jgi:hypothetical protein
MKKMKGSEFRKMVWAVVGKTHLRGIADSTYQEVADLLVASEYNLSQKAVDKSADEIESLLELLDRVARSMERAA